MNRYRQVMTLTLLVSFNLSCLAQKSTVANYIDASEPGLIPKKFAPNFISLENEHEFGSIFSKDGLAFYYAVDSNGKAEIRYTKREKQGWTAPETILQHAAYGFNDPFLSPDEQQLFYISDMPRNEKDTIKDIDIWYSKKTTNGWSEPINAGSTINSDKNEYYISFTNDNTMYFASNKMAPATRNHDFDIYAAARIDGKFEVPKKLNDSINTKRYEADVFIAPDASYIIFAAGRADGFGNGDLYISFKDENNQWKKAQNMGAAINSDANELCPFVTHDGQYFFYTSKQDIYWVSTKIFDQFK